MKIMLLFYFFFLFIKFFWMEREFKPRDERRKNETKTIFNNLFVIRDFFFAFFRFLLDGDCYRERHIFSDWPSMQFTIWIHMDCYASQSPYVIRNDLIDFEWTACNFCRLQLPKTECKTIFFRKNKIPQIILRMKLVPNSISYHITWEFDFSFQFSVFTSHISYVFLQHYPKGRWTQKTYCFQFENEIKL